MTLSTPSRPLTRSQTSTSVLGKRMTRALTRSSSVVSNASSTPLPTPEHTPKVKRVRTSLEENDGRANKENIPPLRGLELEFSTSLRSRRRASISSDVSVASSESTRTTPHGQASRTTLPQTPATTMANLTLVTPPPTPPVTVPLHLQIRGLLRATSNACQGFSMAGREKEQNIIESFLHSFDEDSDVPERILYVSGTPGTGKTALVNSVIANTKLEEDVKIVFINCMAVPSIDMLWQRLEEELSVIIPKAKPGRRAMTKSKLQGKDVIASLLEKRADLKCILVLDELDSLSKTSSAALQSLFKLSVTYSTLRIIGIANTHTLTASSSFSSLFQEFEGTASSSSRPTVKQAIPVKTIHFSPYSSDELVSILKKRLEGLPQNDVHKFLPMAALMLLTKKVSSLTGDVRVLFEVLRGAIDQAVPASSDPSSLSSALILNDPMKTSVSPSHILAALKTYAPSSPSKAKGTPLGAPSGPTSNSETVTKVKNLNLQARLVLLALALASRRISSPLPFFSPSLSSPTKTIVTSTRRSPIKRSTSAASVTFGESEASASGIDTTQLHAYYSSLLTLSDTFSPVSRLDFTDILGVLETTGLLSLSSPSTRTFKRTTSFTSVAGKGKGPSSAGGSQLVSLRGDVREVEILRGLGIESASDGEGDVLEDDVRTIWTRETQKIRREAKAKDDLMNNEDVVGFDDALEN